MNTNTKLTPENASKYIGREILFTYNGATVKRTLLKVSESGKTIRIDYPELKNNLQLVSRKIFVVDDTVVDKDIAESALKIPVLKRESAQEFIFPLAHNNEFIRSDLKADFNFSECEEYECDENDVAIAEMLYNEQMALEAQARAKVIPEVINDSDEEEDGETYFMCTGKCKRVCHYEDTDGEGMCGKCQFHLSISASRKSKLATK